MDQTISLSTNEWRLMDLLWEKSPRTVTELLHISQREIGWGKHTILTMLSRLEAKGAVRHEQGPRAKNFYPAIPRDATARRINTARPASSRVRTAAPPYRCSSASAREVKL